MKLLKASNLPHLLCQYLFTLLLAKKRFYMFAHVTQLFGMKMQKLQAKTGASS